MENFETVVVETDLLLVGGGMACCGAAVEAAHWAKKNNLKVTMVDKAAVDRSGAVAMGLSAINQYVGLKDGQNTMKDYVDYVRNDLMGITREDLVASIARHVDSDGENRSCRRYSVSVQMADAEVPEIRLGSWRSQGPADRLAALLREELGLPRRAAEFA